MGKSKPRHRSNRRHNKSQPTGIPRKDSVEETESELNLTKNVENFSIESIIEEIQSSSVEERLCGLQSLVTLAEKPESVDTIVKCKVIKIIAPMLIDKSSEVRNFTAGILRNLSASGSEKVIETLVKDDIMTSIIALLHKYSDWNPETSKSADTDTLLQVVNILWNLCETDETALRHFNSANLLNILLRCLDHETVGLDLCIAVCQCLNSVSEDNTDVACALRSRESDLFRILGFSSTDHKLLLLKTLAAGIIMNLNVSSPWLAPVLAVVHEALKVDVRQLMSQLSSQLPLDTSSELSADSQTLLDNIKTLTDAQIMALEILTNLTTNQDDEMDVESEDSASDDEGELNGWSEADESHILGLSTEVSEGLEKYQLVTTVYNRTESLPENVMDIITTCPYSRVLSRRIVRLQCRAFLCFNNLVSAVDIEQFGSPHHLYSLVKQISSQRLCVNPQPSGFDSNTELIEASTAAIRAILLRLASIKFCDLGEVHPSDLDVIMKIGLLPEPRVQANVIRIVATLGVLLVSNALVVKTVGHYLLEVVEKQQTLWLTAEALDSLMDVFAEDCTDQTAAELNLVQRLQALAPRLKSKMRQERRTLGEHYPVVSTVMTNLNPFIKYKGARLSTFSGF